MPTGHATAADTELIERVGRQGREVTVRQLQSWRRLGIIPGPPVIHKGRGKGTESGRYPDGAEVAVVRVLDTLGKCGRMPLVVLALFGAGTNPTNAALISAYRWMVERYAAFVESELVKLDEYGNTSAQHVRRFASMAGKELPGTRERWNRRAKAEADAERTMDEDIGARTQTKPGDVRERHLRALYESVLDREDGDPRPFVAMLGMDEQETEETIARTGGPADVGELAEMLDDVEAAFLIRLRDHVRAQWITTFAPALPPLLAAEVTARWNDPATGGLFVASTILSAGAVVRRAAIRARGETVADTA